MTIEIAYWVKDCGDGSVSVKFYDDLALAKYLEEEEELRYGGWGETSATSLIQSHVKTKHRVLWEKVMDYLSYEEEGKLDEIKRFFEEFFDNKMPKYKVIEDNSDEDEEKWNYVVVFVGYDNFVIRELKQRSVTLDKINSFIKSL